MRAELITTIKDIAALSGVSERTAKRRLAKMPKATPFRDLRRYCKFHDVDFQKALDFKLAKRYDPLFRNRRKREEGRFFSYSVETWEEPYRLGREIYKVLFHEAKFFEPDKGVAAGSLWYFTVPVAFLDYAADLSLPLFTEFSESVLPVEGKAELLQLYGLMVVKRSAQARMAFIEKGEVSDLRLADFARTLRRAHRNSKKIWFCKTHALRPEVVRGFGFREIEGTGFAVTGVPGSEVKGKVEVRIENQNDGLG